MCVCVSVCVCVCVCVWCVCVFKGSTKELVRDTACTVSLTEDI